MCSVWPPVPGSLILGGYDRSRCISTPIVSDHDFLLAELSLEVTSGGWPFLNPSGVDSKHLLRSGNANNNSLTITPNPGVPYMYLPESTCSTIASFLPVTFDQKIGYYIWNTTDPAFKNIMSSPSALKFSFGTDSGVEDIWVPLVLLNLTFGLPSDQHTNAILSLCSLHPCRWLALPSWTRISTSSISRTERTNAEVFFGASSRTGYEG